MRLVTSPERSSLMTRVRQEGTIIEDEVACTLREYGYSYRRNVKTLPGSPDFANKRRNWAIFVNGCFWHFHENCKLAAVPKTNRQFWERKRLQNRERDARKTAHLESCGFVVLVIWQCELKDKKRLADRISKLPKSG